MESTGLLVCGAGSILPTSAHDWYVAVNFKNDSPHVLGELGVNLAAQQWRGRGGSGGLQHITSLLSITRLRSASASEQ